MKKTTAIIALFGLAVISVTSSFDTLSNNGIAGKTGSPGESTCNISCHTGSVINDGTGSITISSANNPTWQYMPGDTYNIDVTVSRASNSLFGVDVECLTAVSPQQNAGTLIITNTTQTVIKTNTVSSVSRRNVVHKLNGGTGSGSHTFSFKWVSPTTNVGNVTFYATGNAANNNNSQSGDHIYKLTQVVTPAAGAGINNNSENSNGLSVFPNPAHDNLSVSYNAEAGEEVSIRLISIDGKIVSVLHQATSDGIPVNLNLPLPADISQGIYLVQMIHGNISTTRRIIIQ
ncbi:hypothetical protein BH09BAC5_BH09BAC5_18240 [soil metagenome]